MVLSMDTLLEEQFHQSLRLDHKRAVPIPCAIKHVKSAFGGTCRARGCFLHPLVSCAAAIGSFSQEH